MKHANRLASWTALRCAPLFGWSLLLGACSGGLQASGGLKLDGNAGLSTKLDGGASTQAGAPAKSVSEPREVGEALEEALGGSHRSEENRQRDVHRHPRETLEFFGLKTDMTVLEVEPGADGWFSEILAPVLRDHGRYVVTNFDVNGPEKSPLTRVAQAFQAKLAAHPEVYGKVEVLTLTEAYDLGEPNSVDMVVTFRNSHLWKQDKIEDRVYAAMFEVLKPGGVLGIEQHRACAGDSAARTYTSGYLPQPYVIERIEKAGFVFEAESHVNANSWDTRDHPKGVWTLPPSFALGEKDREKYAKIGESDRMTLRFRKPASATTPAARAEGSTAAGGEAEKATPRAGRAATPAPAKAAPAPSSTVTAEVGAPPAPSPETKPTTAPTGKAPESARPPTPPPPSEL